MLYRWLLTDEIQYCWLAFQLSMTAGCVADTDVAVSVFIILQRLFCKSLQVVSKVPVLVLISPVLGSITGRYSDVGVSLRSGLGLDGRPYTIAYGSLLRPLTIASMNRRKKLSFSDNAMGRGTIVAEGVGSGDGVSPSLLGESLLFSLKLEKKLPSNQ